MDHDLFDLKYEMVEAFYRRVTRMGLSREEITTNIKEVLENDFEAYSEKNIKGSPSAWADKIAERKQTQGIQPGTPDQFVRQVLAWVEERFGYSWLRDNVIISNAERYGHVSTLFGKVVYRFRTGISFQELFNRIIRQRAPGTSIDWLDTAVAERLTQDFFDDIGGEEQLGERRYEDFSPYQSSLDKLIEAIGFEPIVLSYLTGNRDVLMYALGQEGYYALKVLEAAGDVRDYEDRIVENVVVNLNSGAKLSELGLLLNAYLQGDSKCDH